MYRGVCDIFAAEPVRDPAGTVTFRETPAYTGVPCKLSFKTMTVRTLTSSSQTESAAQVVQSVKLITAPEIRIPPGSRISVEQDGVRTDYCSSGKPAVFPAHQEVMLELAQKWA